MLLHSCDSIIVDVLKWLTGSCETILDNAKPSIRIDCLELVIRQYAELLASFAARKTIGNPIGHHQQKNGLPHIASSLSVPSFFNSMGTKYRGLIIALNGIHTILIGNGSTAHSRRNLFR